MHEQVRSTRKSASELAYLRLFGCAGVTPQNSIAGRPTKLDWSAGP